jgi:arabinose-5-phosphate isomerase
LKTKQEILALAKHTILDESQSIEKLASLLTDDFADVVSRIYKSEGRVIITGIGKSAIIASKIVATMNSTGTPAVFMHAADAIHGDLGIVQDNDVVICISKSGNTPEIKVLVPLLKQRRNVLVALTGNTESYLGIQADYVLNSYVEHEACPNNLAPMNSTTAQLVIGDALAACLLEMKSFSSEDFARYHPGGSLGKKLYLKVGDLSVKNLKPSVASDCDLKAVIVEISSKRLGATAVLEGTQLIGVVTDGDLRRMLETGEDITKLTAKDIMSSKPKAVETDVLAAEALRLMEEKNITQLLVTENGNYSGVIHLHDILKEGIL